MPLTDADVTLTDAGRRPARSLGAAAVLEVSRPEATAEPAAIERVVFSGSKNLLLVDMPWDGCKWSTGEAPGGRLLFCGARQENGQAILPMPRCTGQGCFWSEPEVCAAGHNQQAEVRSSRADDRAAGEVIGGKGL
jgi:hypothetical protein